MAQTFKQAPLDRASACPKCGTVILYCDGEATPSLLFQRGQVVSVEPITDGKIIGCERCIFAAAQPIQASTPRKRVPSPIHTEMPPRYHANSDADAFDDLREEVRRNSQPHSPPSETRSVKEIFKSDAEGVIDLVLEGADVAEKVSSFVRKIFPKKGPCGAAK
jgi:hypothetical protein